MFSSKSTAVLFVLCSAWPASAGVAFVQNPTSTAASATTCTTGSATWTTGNTIIVSASIRTTTSTVSSITQSAGSNTYIFRSDASGNNSTNVRLETWIARNITGGTFTVTVNLSATSKVVCSAAEYSGVAAIGNVAFATGSAANPTSPAVTMDDANDMCVGGFAGQSTGTFSASAGNLRGNAVNTGGSAASNNGGAEADNTAAKGSSCSQTVINTDTTWALANVELRMDAFAFKVGSFNTATVTGNQAVTGVGFQPKAILFFMRGDTGTVDGSATVMNLGFGIAVSSTSRVAIANNAGAGNAALRQDNTKAISVVNNAGTVIADADFVSMDADGFTINNTTTDALARVVDYVALGGSDLTNVLLKQITLPAATGNQATTGVGFKPDAVLLVSARGTSAPLSTGGQLHFGIGFGTSSTVRNTSTYGDSGAANGRKQISTAVLSVESGSATLNEADLVSLDADGFTLNWTILTEADLAWVLCLKGGQFKPGSFNQATATGNQGTTGVGFQPVGLIFASFNAASSTTPVTAAARLSIGAATSSTARENVWGGETNFSTNADDADRTKAIKLLTEATPTLNAAADFVSLDADGFTLNWTTADATAREVLYWAFGNVAVAGPSCPKTRLTMGVGC